MSRRLFVIATAAPHNAPVISCTGDGWSAWYIWCNVLHRMQLTSIRCECIETTKIGWPAYWCKVLHRVSYVRGIGGGVLSFGEPEE